MYNETNLPILRYLKWRRPLIQHPEFVKSRTKAMGMSSLSSMSRQMPFLGPLPGLLTDASVILNANDALLGISRIWPEFAEAASSNIEAVSSAFTQAMSNTYDTFINTKLFKELEGQRLNGTLIFPEGYTLCYDFAMRFPEERGGSLIYAIEGNAISLNNGRYLLCDMFEDFDMNGQHNGLASWHDFESRTWHSPTTGKGIPEDSIFAQTFNDDSLLKLQNDTLTENIMGMFDCIIVFHLFKKYATVEEVMSTRERQQRGGMMEIKTTHDVHYLDCSWYTTIIRTEGFGVRGHFRLQPCGPDKKDKKLIYIHEYQKHGYVRRARILRDAEENK